MTDQYNNKTIINKIIDYKFTFEDLNPNTFPVLQDGLGMYCLWHENSHRGTKHARMYYNDDMDLWYIYCYVCGKAYYSHDYVNVIMVKERNLYKSGRDFLLEKIGKDEFIALYTLFEKQTQGVVESDFKKKCNYIDNTFAETGNVSDYIEKLYTA